MDSATAGSERRLMVGTLKSALAALESGDDGAWRRHVEELVQWRTRPLVQGLLKLARELEHTLGSGSAGAGSLPEACQRLEHVVRVSEESSHYTLDLIQACGTLLGTLGQAEGDERASAISAMRGHLSEMTAAQGYQDLTGQIIRRVVELVRAVHAGLGEVSGDDAPLQFSGHGFGPSVAGVDAPATSQDDANSLLSSLGL